MPPDTEEFNLEGKSLDEVAAHYKELLSEKDTTHAGEKETLNIQLESSNTALLAERNKKKVEPKTQEETPPNKPDAASFFSDPQKASEQVVKNLAVSKEEFADMGNANRSTMTAAAKLVAKADIKDWDRFETDIIKIVNQLEPQSQTLVATWQMAYTHVKGVNADLLVAEGKAEATRVLTEQNTPPAPEKKDEVKLTNEQEKVAAGLGISNEQMTKGVKQLESGKWPMT